MKKVTGQVKLQIPAGKANPAPPIGPALGQQGVNIMEFCKQFNATDPGAGQGRPDHPGHHHRVSGPLLHLHPEDASRGRPLKKAAGLHTEKKKGSGAKKPGKEKVGQITQKQLEEIAKKKIDDTTAGSLEAAMRTIAGTARSMGIEVVG